MHARTTLSLSTRHGRHDGPVRSQAAEVEWSSLTMDIYDWTSRGPLRLVVVHSGVQWFAARRRACGARAIARCLLGPLMAREVQDA